jgi:hypothetical protein
MTVSNPTNDPNSSTKTTVPRPGSKVRFYRQCRLWHGYLSAFAFATLLFFAATGVLLNHPKWYAATEPRRPPIKLTLTSSQLQALHDADAPAQMLTQMVSERTRLYGEYKSGESAIDQIFVRLRGARGASDIRANLREGSVVVVSERATTLGLLNALHRGEQAGMTWRTLIDVAGGILIVLALLGYAILFSMSARLKTSLIVTGLSVLGTMMLIVTAVR